MNRLKSILFFLALAINMFGQTLIFKKENKKIVISNKQEVNFRLRDSSNIVGYLKTVNDNNVVILTKEKVLKTILVADILGVEQCRYLIITKRKRYGKHCNITNLEGYKRTK